MRIRQPVATIYSTPVQHVSAVPEAHPVKLLLTVAEGAAALGIGRTHFYDLLMRGKIVSVKVGAARRVPLMALHRYVAELCEEAS
jgi:excisionase family DNA binding protein